MVTALMENNGATIPPLGQGSEAHSLALSSWNRASVSSEWTPRIGDQVYFGLGVGAVVTGILMGPGQESSRFIVAVAAGAFHRGPVVCVDGVHVRFVEVGHVTGGAPDRGDTRRLLVTLDYSQDFFQSLLRYHYSADARGQCERDAMRSASEIARLSSLVAMREHELATLRAELVHTIEKNSPLRAEAALTGDRGTHSDMVVEDDTRKEDQNAEDTTSNCVSGCLGGHVEDSLELPGKVVELDQKIDTSAVPTVVMECEPISPERWTEVIGRWRVAYTDGNSTILHITALEDDGQQQLPSLLLQSSNPMGECKLTPCRGKDAEGGFTHRAEGHHSFAGKADSTYELLRSEDDKLYMTRWTGVRWLDGTAEKEEEEEPPTGIRGCLARLHCGHETEDDILHTQTLLGKIITSTSFESFCACAILSNAALLGYTAEHQIIIIGQPPMPEPQIISNGGMFFCVFYTVELILKLIVFRGRFFCNNDMSWNIFDFVLVITAIEEQIEKYLPGGGGGVNLTFLRALRLMKMLRVLRMVRVMRFFRELRMMLFAIIASMRSLFWSMVMLLLILYCYALVFMQATSSAVETFLAIEEPTDEDASIVDNMELYFGSVYKSMLSLFMAISGGNDWITYSAPLWEANNPFYYYMFLFFIAFITFALMNILTGIFCDAAMDAAKNDVEAVALSEHERDEQLCGEVGVVFSKMSSVKPTSADGLWTMSREEFQDEMRAHASECKVFLEYLELGVDVGEQANELFNLFSNRDGNKDELTLQEFQEGILKLKGPAKNIDMVLLLRQQKSLTQACEQQIADIKGILKTEKPCPAMSMGPQVGKTTSSFSRYASKHCGHILEEPSDTSSNQSTSKCPWLWRFIHHLHVGEFTDTDITRQESKIGQLVLCKKFELTCAVAIATNSMILGWSAEWSIKHPRERNYVIETFNMIFCVIYIIELTCKLCVYRLRFFCNADYRWNIFDTLLVATGLQEQLSKLFDLGTGGANVTFLRMFRLLKLVRVLRIMRVMRFFRELRRILYSVVSSFMNLLWTLLMLGLVMYIFGLCFLNATQSVLEEIANGDPTLEQTESEAGIRECWGSVRIAMTTLYMAITGGNDWDPLASPLLQAGDAYYYLFLVYIAFMTVAVLNILTGIFVDNAMQAAEQDTEANIENLIAYEDQIAQQILEIFREGNTNHNGKLTWEEFHLQLQNEKVQFFFEHLEINHTQAETLFHLLDHNDTNYVCINEFLNGCKELKGHARNMDLVQLLHLQRDFGVYIKTQFFMIGAELRHLGLAEPDCKAWNKAGRVDCKNFSSAPLLLEKPGLNATEANGKVVDSLH